MLGGGFVVVRVGFGFGFAVVGFGEAVVGFGEAVVGATVTGADVTGADVIGADVSMTVAGGAGESSHALTIADPAQHRVAARRINPKIPPPPFLPRLLPPILPPTENGPGSGTLQRSPTQDTLSILQVILPDTF